MATQHIGLWRGFGENESSVFPAGAYTVHLIDGKAMCACEMSCCGAQYILPFRVRATKFRIIAMKVSNIHALAMVLSFISTG
jgi:hypothetical protein